MNKAFVREPDATDELCPRCGSIGVQVSREIIERHVREESREQIASVANFCPSAKCEVAYFDVFERVLLTSALLRSVYPKDLSAPICPCFGLTCDDIDDDIAEGTNQRTKSCVLRAQSPEARCAECSPSGRSCVAEVQRYFLQRRAGK
jgi:hypothetical protein